MSAPSKALLEAVSEAPAAPAARNPVRPLYWSVRRELWENRSIHLAPTAIAGAIVGAFTLSIVAQQGHRLVMLLLGGARYTLRIGQAYDFAARMMAMTTVMVGILYCLEALNGERRDRTILFWKSLPVSDGTTVVSKAIVPLAVLPLLAFGLTIATHLAMLLVSNVGLLASGAGPAWPHPPTLLHLWLTVLYGVVAMTLWHAPVYAWLLFVSARARRAAYLWAVVPLAVPAVVEMAAFQGVHYATFLRYRAFGWAGEAFALGRGPFPFGGLAQLTPGRFLASPGLWAGLAVAAALLAAAARVRRARDPV